MFFTEPGNDEQSSDAGRPLAIARDAARTVPWVMGILAAGMREHGAGLHPAQVRVLMAMHGRTVGPSELADRLQVSLPTISKTLAVLERHGWVERVPDDADRRRVVVRTTPQGQQRMTRAIQDGVGQLAEALTVASDAELDAIERGLESLRAVLARTDRGRRGHGCGGSGEAHRHGQATGGGAAGEGAGAPVPHGREEGGAR